MTAPPTTTTHPSSDGTRRWGRPVRGTAVAVLLAALVTSLAPAPAVAAAPGDPPTAGVSEFASRPSVFAGGTAQDRGSTGGITLSGGLKDLARTPSGRGYWLLGSDGGVFTYGDAGFFGSTGGIVLNQPAVAMAPTASGEGYWFVASDGGVFTFGDAAFHGSAGAVPLNAPVVGMVPTSTGDGYFLVASDGGVFTYGDAPFLGSTGDQVLPSPAVSLTAAPDGRTYWLLLADGSVRSFPGGRVASQLPGTRAVDIQVTPTGRGYWVLDSDGGVHPYGDATDIQPAVSLWPGGEAVAVAATPDGRGLWVATNGRLRPPGTATATGPFAFMVADRQGRPGRWNPCAGPIPWHLNLGGALSYIGAEGIVADAFEYMEGVTGLDFTYAGPTTLNPLVDRIPGAIVVGWVPALDSEQNVGRGGASYREGPGGPVATNGAVALNASALDALPMTWQGRSWGPVVLHELAHVVGLAHVDDASQLMYFQNTGQSDFGPGDLAGLHQLGAAQGCA